MVPRVYLSCLSNLIECPTVLVTFCIQQALSNRTLATNSASHHTCSELPFHSQSLLLSLIFDFSWFASCFNRSTCPIPLEERPLSRSDRKSTSSQDVSTSAYPIVEDGGGEVDILFNIVVKWSELSPYLMKNNELPVCTHASGKYIFNLNPVPSYPALPYLTTD
ncbi:hypothetical protein CDAR_415581 [Caerostris darwini]|uniref:Uncharacterized protein n=1 Tax=Caerostris darwini TaxID=1538125 RepID=A0AAV4Q5T9_9ARAC|nr:hypothetical protein CDAR_415581 [Caerostris darwini]